MYWRSVIARRSPRSAPVFLSLSVMLLIGLGSHGPQLTADSVVVQRQAEGLQSWTNHHPWPYTFLGWLGHYVGDTPTVLVVVQILAMAAALTRLVGVLSRRFGLGYVPWGVALLLVLPLPMQPRPSLGLGAFTLFMWKDVLFAAAAIWLAAALLARVAPRGTPASLAKSAAELSIASAAMSAFRWNGVVAVVATVAVVFFALPHGRRLALSLATVAGGVAGLGVILLGPALGVAAMPDRYSNAVQISDLAWIAANKPEHLDFETRTLMEQVAPLEAWQKSGRGCESVDPVVYGFAQAAPQRSAELEALAPALADRWRDEALQHPQDLVAIRLCRLSPLVAPVVFDDGGAPVLSPGRLLSRGVPVTWLLVLTAIVTLTRVRPNPVTSTLGFLAVPIGVVASYAAQPYAADVRYYLVAVFLCLVYVFSFLASAFLGFLVARRQPGPPVSIGSETAIAEEIARPIDNAHRRHE